MEEPKKSYYAIIPGNVRYDKELPANAKLLYGEITALCNEKGYCWASNQYFSELYGVSKVSISKWISALVKRGYIKNAVVYKKGTKEIDYRYLSLVNDPIKENLNTPIKEKFKENNTVIFNNTSNNTYESMEKRKRFIPPTLDEVRAYCLERGNNIDPERFIDYYIANGWTQGKGKPIKDWKAAVRNWERNDIDRNTSQNQQQTCQQGKPQNHYQQVKPKQSELSSFLSSMQEFLNEEE